MEEVAALPFLFPSFWILIAFCSSGGFE